MRDDLRGRLAPAHLNRWLTATYGRTWLGEPKFRLVWGESRIERSGGVWREPGCERLGFRAVRKYPGCRAWLIEAWRPPATYGTPEAWYAPVQGGGTRMMTPWGAICCLGDYPSRGDYEDIGARMFWAPVERHLAAAIWLWRRTEQASANPLARTRARVLAAEQAAAAAEERFVAQGMDVLGETDLAFDGAPMASMAGEKRRPALVDLAERAGITAHPF